MNTNNSNLFNEFAIHAPDIPEWFERKKWSETTVEKHQRFLALGSKEGWVHEVRGERTEDPMAYLVRWRTTYATEMMNAINTPPKVVPVAPTDLNGTTEKGPQPEEIAFLQGAKWWEWKSNKATMFQSDQEDALARASQMRAIRTLGTWIL